MKNVAVLLSIISKMTVRWGMLFHCYQKYSCGYSNNDDSFKYRNTSKELDEPVESEVSCPPSKSECPSCKSIFIDSDEWPVQSSNFFLQDMENTVNGLRGLL